MENKYRIIIICMVFVVMGGMLFDLSHRASKFEQQKLQNEQTATNSFVSKIKKTDSTETKTDTSEMEFMAMAQNAKMKVTPVRRSEKMETIVTREELENVPEFTPETANSAGQSAVKKFDFPQYGISVLPSMIPAKYRAHDLNGNNYYFLPAAKGTDILGLLVKTDSSDAILWTKAIKYERIAKPNVRLITFVSKNLKVYFSQRNGMGAYPVNLNAAGSVLKNPYAPVYYTNLAPGSYRFSVLKDFTYKNNVYSIVSFLDLKAAPKSNPVSEEFYIYKNNDGNLVKHYLLFDRKLPVNGEMAPEPEFDVVTDEQYLSIVAKSPASSEFPAFNRAVRFGVDILTANLKPPQTSAPSAVGPGVSIIDIEK